MRPCAAENVELGKTDRLHSWHGLQVVQHLEQGRTLLDRIDPANCLHVYQQHVGGGETRVHGGQPAEREHQQAADEEHDQAERDLHRDERPHDGGARSGTAACLERRDRRHARGAQGRNEAEESGHEEGENTRERQQPPVQAQVEPHGIVRGRKHADHGWSGNAGEQQPERADREGDKRALDQHLLNEATPSGADRQPERHLTLARGHSGEKEIRDIGAGDHQQESRDRHQNPQRTLELAPQRGWAVCRRPDEELALEKSLEPFRRPIGTELARRVLAAEVRERRLQHIPGLLGTDVVGQPANHAKPVELEISKCPRVVHRVRHPQVRRPARLDARKLALGHADDLELTLLQAEPAADDSGIAAEPALPVRIADDGDR